MVGVAGRSKGCNTCRKRKIACDLLRPHCNQCLKSNRICTGYQRETVFIVNQGYASKPTGAEVKTSQDSDSSDSLSCRKKNRQSVAPRQNSQPNKTDLCVPSIRDLDSFVLGSSYRSWLFHGFLKVCLPHSLSSSLQPKHWLALIAETPTPTEALAISSSAISLARIGRMQRNPKLLKESHRLYTQALHEFQLSLWKPEEMFEDETLAACMILAMYEFLECPAKTKYGYVSHHRGCSRLVQLRGPQAHSSGLGHAVFQVFRSQGILQALELHAETYLSDPSWMEVPFEKIPKTPLDRVWDLIAAAPGIFAQSDQFPFLEGYDRVSLALRLHQQCLKLDTDLQNIFQEIVQNTPGPLYWPEFARDDKVMEVTGAGKLFPVAFYFPNMLTAYTLILYWATCTMLWHGSRQLCDLVLSTSVETTKIPTERTLPDILRRGLRPCDKNCACRIDQIESCVTTFDRGELPQLEPTKDFMITARNVCQSAEYCMQDEMLDHGPTLFVAPLTIVLETIKPYPQCHHEVQWAIGMIEKIRQRSLPSLNYFYDPSSASFNEAEAVL